MKNLINLLTENVYRLTEKEAIANALLVYAAAYDTTAIALATLAHQFVNFPLVQEKVRQEVYNLYQKKGGLDFDGIDFGLKYFDCVIKETLRLYTPVESFISRECLKDYKYEGMIIPKGSKVTIAINSLHNDPEYWTNTENFDPNRFSSEDGNEIVPFTFQVFGEGPRNCIGMRFAFLEIKLAFAKLFLRYRLESGPRTEIGKLSRTLGNETLQPKNGVSVKAVKVKA